MAEIVLGHAVSMIADSALSNIVSWVARRVSDVLIQESEVLTEVRMEVEWIERELRYMQALLWHHKRSNSNQLEEDIRIIVFETQDAIDTFLPKLGRRKKGRRHLLQKYDAVKELQRISDRVREISERIRSYDEEYRAEFLWTVQTLRPRTQPSLVDKESPIVGLDGEIEILMAQLLSDEEHLCIFSIVGIQGIGKTTLAKLLFDKKAVIDHFDCRVWVTVSPSLKVEGDQLLEEIAKQAATQIMGLRGQGDSEIWTTKDSIRTLRVLADKKFLLVVDGLQTCHFLDTLTDKILDKSTGSRFLLTTRNPNIILPQLGIRSFFLHLQLLDDENSWILFKKNLRVDIPSEEIGKKNVAKCGGLPSEIIKMAEEIGKKIVAKCGSLPSEIIKMGDLLSHEDVEEAWSSVLMQPYEGHNSWSEQLNTVNTNSLSGLRRCLFYFELFPANFGIPARRLVVLWIAEGVVSGGKDQEPPELVAERYLTELIDLNMVQIVKRKSNGKVKTCRLPNALRELLLMKPDGPRFPQDNTGTDLNTVSRNFKIREVVADRLDKEDTWHEHIHGNTVNDSASLETYKDVLSFLSFDDREGSKPGQDVRRFLNLCISSNCFLELRVLDLEGVHKPKLPRNIAKLTLLRYLGLRWTYLESLPSFISRLLKLQTLDLKHTYIHTLTSSIWKMELRHLFLSETYRTRFPPKPKGTGIGSSLFDLQTLWGLFVDEETPVKGGLDKLLNIRKLGIACQSMSLQQEAMQSQLDAVAQWIMNLDKLQSLRLKSRDEEGKPWNLHSMSLENHICLNDIYLLGSLIDPSILSQFPPSLVELTLSHSRLDVDPMPLLENLPKLRSLSLFAESYVGDNLVCHSQGFPQLYILKLWKLNQLKEWNIEEKALPSLKQLEIRSCPRMKMLPDGLKYVSSLLELKLTNMPEEINLFNHNTPPKCEVKYA